MIDDVFAEVAPSAPASGAFPKFSLRAVDDPSGWLLQKSPMGELFFRPLFAILLHEVRDDVFRGSSLGR